MGVAEEFLDDDEVHALFQEQGRGRVPEIVEADAAQSPTVEEGDEASCEVGGVDGAARQGGKDEAGAFPSRSGYLALGLLLLPMDLAGRPSGCVGVSGGRSPFRVEVEVFPAHAEEFAFAESGP